MNPITTSRTALLFFALCIISLSSLAQGDIQFSVSVINTTNKPAPNLPVEAMETSTLKRISGKTDVQGRSILQLKGGKEWTISIGEMKKCMYVTAIPDRAVTTNKFLVYDPQDYKRKLQQDPSRVNDKFKVIPQQIKENATFPQGNCMLEIFVEQPDGKKLQGISVQLVDLKDSLIYKATTNEKGLAIFVLPNKKKYEIDLNNLKNYSYADFGDEYRIHGLHLVYAPTVVKEKIVNDTIYQESNPQAQPSSERALMHLTVRGGKKGGVNERVYLRQLPSGKIFSVQADANGVAHVLLPIKYVYMIDFKYQKNADAINMKYVNDLTTGKMNVSYSPDPRLEYPETFIPTPDRLLIRSFHQFVEKQYPKPKNKPLNIELKLMRKLHRQSREALFMLTLTGADEFGKVRLPLNAALVLDKSGSMFDDGRSEALKNSLVSLGKKFTGEDAVSIILFDDVATEVQQMRARYSEGLQLVADNYSPGGGTNILGGLERGAESIKKNFDPNKSNKIILLTDGYGDNEPKDVTDFVETKFQEGIEFSTIGLGSDYNQSLLELISLKGNGTFSFVDESTALSEAFLKQIDGSLNYSAKDLSIEIFHNEKLIFSSLYGYPVKDHTKGKISFEIGKVPHATNEIAFLKFKLNQPSEELESTPLKIKISYSELATGKKVVEEKEVKLEWTNETTTEMYIDEQEKKVYAIAILNQSLKLMAEAYEAKNNDAAKQALKDGKAQIDEIFPDAKPKEVKALFEEVERYLGLFYQIEKNAK